MFSGIVETTGIIKQIDVQTNNIKFSISPIINFDDLIIGDSVSINGVCLTVTNIKNNIFDVVAVPETLRITNLSKLSLNNIVNLERSLRVGSRIGGHYVQGHIDGTGLIIDLYKDGPSALITKISTPIYLTKYIVRKGYITLDGMSITIIDVGKEWFIVTFIPHTQQTTLVNQYQIGTSINIEVDVLSKYIEKLLGAY